jgi:antirestriction protein ArdC
MREKVNHAKRMTDQLKALLEPIAAAVAEDSDINASDFVLPFQGCTGRPTNPATGHRATGTNALIAMMKGCNHYSTFDGWQELGYFVNTPADFYLMRPMSARRGEAVDSATGDVTPIYATIGFTSYPVWSFESVRENVRVTMGKRDKHAIPAQRWLPPAFKRQDDTQIIATVDNFIANTNAVIREHGDGRAFYAPALDTITMPLRELFRATKTSTATECYYSTKLHELGHWTGHKSRLDRLEVSNKKGYAFEELVAEITAAMLCADLGVSVSLRADHLQYIKGWLEALDKDVKFIFSAGAKAQQAVEFLFSLQGDEEVAA